MKTYHLSALFKFYKNESRMTDEEIAIKTETARETVSRKLNREDTAWNVKDIKNFSILLRVPASAVAEAITKSITT